MSGFLSGWAGENPFYQGFDKRRNAITGFGVGLMSGTDLREGVANGLVNAQQGRQQDDAHAKTQKDEQERQAAINATTEWLRSQGTSNPFAAEMAMLVDSGAISPNEAFAQVARMAQGGASETTANQRDFLFAQQNGYQGTFADWVNGGGSEAASRLGTTIYTGRDEAGNIIPMQVGQGGFVPTAMPDGVVFDPGALNAERAAGSKFGSGTGEAVFDLPGAELIAQQTIAAINDARAEKAGMAEHFGNVVGIPQQATPAWPGSEKAKFQVAADRAINRAFLEGREMLKGGGQITDFESRKAEAAITAAQSALEKGDQAQFLKALDDFEQAVQDGVVKLRRQAGGTQFSSTRMNGGNPPGGTTAGGLSWSIE